MQFLAIRPQHRGWVSIFLGIALVISLVSCGGKPSVTGKWEQTAGSTLFIMTGSVGSLWEFFDDGTVNIGGLAFKYSWADKTHLKLEMVGSFGLVFEFALSGDELILKDSSSQTAITLKRYQELSPTLQTLAGKWERRSPSDSQCFRGLGLDYDPSPIQIQADGNFQVQDEGILSSGMTMNGQVSVNGARISIVASGTRTSTGLFGGTSKEQVGGQLTCDITLSHSRLVFRDDQGKISVFVRAKE